MHPGTFIYFFNINIKFHLLNCSSSDETDKVLSLTFCQRSLHHHILKCACGTEHTVLRLII